MSASPALQDVFSRYASGVTVVTCRNANGEPHGATVTAFTAISHDPYLCQVALTKKSKACSFLDGQPFAVNFLAHHQGWIAMHFAGRRADPPPVLVEDEVAPYLEESLATVMCRPWRTYDGGDHLIFIGEITGTRIGDAEPLLYYGSAFQRISPIAASHAWDGCSDDPLTGWFDQNTSFIPAHSIPAPAAARS